MLNDIKLSDILFLDIETAPVVYKYTDLNETMRTLWDSKHRFQNDTPEMFYNKAGIFAEFAKVICISVGFYKGQQFNLRSFYGDDEKQLLQSFATFLTENYKSKTQLLCAHNGKEFDFPFLCRRMLILGINLPEILNIAGKKPWEINHLDTMELWKFGDYKNYTSLNLLAAVFNIPTPKDDISGADVARVYWEEKDLKRIVIYCQKDVITVAQLIQRFRNEPLIADENVVYI